MHEKAKSAPVIVIIDDEPSVCVILSEALREYQTFSFGNGEAALEWLKGNLNQVVDLVICDYAMPGLNGVQTLNKISRMARQARLILISGVIADKLQTLAEENFFDGFFAKPFTLSHVKALVDQKLQVPRLDPKAEFNSLHNRPVKVRSNKSPMSTIAATTEQTQQTSPSPPVA